LLLDDQQKVGEHLQAFADLFLIVNDNGEVLQCKFGDCSISLDSREQILSKRLNRILPVDVIDKIDDFLSQARRTGRSDSFEFPLNMDDRDFWFDGSFMSISDTSFVLSARDITKYKKTEHRMQRQLKRLSALRSIDLAIASGLDLKLLLSILLDRVIDTMHVDAAAVLLLDSEMNLLKFGAGKGFHTNILQHTHLKSGEG
jgi:hypothetical protein